MTRLKSGWEAGQVARDLMSQGMKQLRDEAKAAEEAKTQEFSFSGGVVDEAGNSLSEETEQTTEEVQASAIMALTARLDALEGGKQ